jgi:hypothetical protein
VCYTYHTVYTLQLLSTSGLLQSQSGDTRPIRLAAGGWLLVLICYEKKSTTDWWLATGFCSERKSADGRWLINRTNRPASSCIWMLLRVGVCCLFFCDLFVWLVVALVAGVGFFSEKITAAGGWFVTREK